MAKKRSIKKEVLSAAAEVLSPAGKWVRSALAWGAGLLCIWVSVSFFTGTYDTAQVKDTLLLCGGSVLILLWAALLVEERRFFVTRSNWVWYLPFLCYYGFTLASYGWNPYPVYAWPECCRYVVYLGLTLLVLAQFRKSALDILTRCICWTAWISYGYGFLQVLDRFLPGADFMPWRAFFGARIFSTHANPNFFGDFLVFSFFIILAVFMRTRQKRWLVLLGMGLVDLFFTQSKGAWVAFGAVFGVGAVSYINYFSSRLGGYRRWVNGIAAAGAAGAVLLAGVYTLKRPDSAGFRTHTWVSAFSMVQDSPVLGTGVGSFQTIYPAYKKPQIFFIENAHNTETQHAENEFIEQWVTGGTVGLALFLWMLFFVFFAAHKKLVFRRNQNRPESYLLWGYGCALAGILLHNLFDVSLRFASTGLFFAIFLGVVAVLSRPEETQEAAVYEAGDGKIHLPGRSGVAWVLWSARILVWMGLAVCFVWMTIQFMQITGNMSSVRFGDAVLKFAAWGGFLFCACGCIWAAARAAGLFVRPAAAGVLLLIVPAVYVGFKPFVADHYYGIATGFAVRNQADGALDFFQKAIQANPLNLAYRQYRATMLTSRLDLSKTFNPKKGDTDSPATDYDRVLRDLNAVASAAPNHVLLHQAYGEFYYTAALRFSNLASAAPDREQYEKYKKWALDNMEQARKHFEYSLLLDPVNEATYVFLTEIAILQRQPEQARRWIEAYRRGPAEITDPALLDKRRFSPRINALERRLQAAFPGK